MKIVAFFSIHLEVSALLLMVWVNFSLRGVEYSPVTKHVFWLLNFGMKPCSSCILQARWIPKTNMLKSVDPVWFSFYIDYVFVYRILRNMWRNCSHCSTDSVNWLKKLSMMIHDSSQREIRFVNGKNCGSTRNLLAWPKFLHGTE